jgi:hypothetical protein
MKAGRTIGLIGAAIVIVFGVLMLVGAFSEDGQPSWIIIGVILITVGFGIIWFVRPRDDTTTTVEVVQKIELSGDVELESFNCRHCGGPLTSKNIEVVAGAPVVTCPYCGSIYQISEEPKW